MERVTGMEKKVEKGAGNGREIRRELEERKEAGGMRVNMGKDDGRRDEQEEMERKKRDRQGEC